MTKKLHDSLTNGYDFRLTDYISEGWQIFSQDSGNFVGYTAVYFVISIGSGIIPIIGSLLNILILSPCLIAGYYLAAQRIQQGEKLVFGDFFRGFDYLRQLILVALVEIGLLLIFIGPIIIIFFGLSFSFSAFRNFSGVPFTLIGFIFCFMIAYFFILVCWIFANQFIVFHKMPFWDAMETSRKLVMKNWFSVFALLILLGLLQMVGAIACCIGLLVSSPLMYCSLFAAFKDIAGLPEDESGTDDMIESIGQP